MLKKINFKKIYMGVDCFVMISLCYMIFGLFVNKYFVKNDNIEYLPILFLITSLITNRLCNFTKIERLIKCCKHECRHLELIKENENIETFIINPCLCSFNGKIPINIYQKILLNPTKLSLIDLKNVYILMTIVFSSFLFDGYFIFSYTKSISIKVICVYILVKLVNYILLVMISGLCDIDMYKDSIKKEKEGYNFVVFSLKDGKKINKKHIYQRDTGITKEDIIIEFVKE